MDETKNWRVQLEALIYRAQVKDMRAEFFRVFEEAIQTSYGEGYQDGRDSIRDSEF